MIVIFNGPPSSGKDEAAAYFKENFNFENLSFKDQLYNQTIQHFEVNEEWFMEGYNDRNTKEKKEVALGDRSRREAMIYTSEEIIKPKEGKDFFGRCVAEEIEKGKHYALADGGFHEEIVPIIEKVGVDNVIVVQLTRENHDFSSDSRRYFNGKLIKEYAINGTTRIDNRYVLEEELDVRTYRIHNNGSIRNFHETLNNIFEELNNDFRKTEGNANSQCDQS